MAVAKRAALIAPALPIAKVPTGTPPGICAIESSESRPCNALDSTGTPRTGNAVFEAHMPGRWAAPPAPAMITSSPRSAALSAYSKSQSGVRCAETTFDSNGTASASSCAAACCIVSQSDCEPMMMPTSGLDFCAFGMLRGDGQAFFVGVNLHEHALLFVRFQHEVRGGGNHSLHRGEFLGNEGCDFAQVAALNDHHQVVTAGHQITRLHFCVLGNAFGQAIESAAALGRNLHLDDGSNRIQTQLFFVQNRAIAQNDLLSFVA